MIVICFNVFRRCYVYINPIKWRGDQGLEPSAIISVCYSMHRLIHRPYRLPPTGTNQLLHSILFYSILLYSTLRCAFCSGYNKHRYLNIIFQQPWWQLGHGGGRKNRSVRKKEQDAASPRAAAGDVPSWFLGLKPPGKEPYL
jgi:hypothetical protein